MKVERLETIRVRLEDDFYCDITPSPEEEGIYDFRLQKCGFDSSLYMFSVSFENEADAVKIATLNAPDYFSELNEEIEQS